MCGGPEDRPWSWLAFVCVLGGERVIDYTGGDIGDSHIGEAGDGLGPDGVDNPHHQASQEYINGNNIAVKDKEKKVDTAV